MNEKLGIIISAITLLVTALTPVLLALINRKQTKALENSAAAKIAVIEVAAKVEAATANTATKMDEIAKVGVDTHTLVNSNMSVQLQLVMVATRRLADLTKNREDETAAVMAQLAYNEHIMKQAVVDSGVKTKGAVEEKPKPKP